MYLHQSHDVLVGPELQLPMEFFLEDEGVAMFHSGCGLSCWAVKETTSWGVSQCGDFLSHRATPSYHPFLDGIFYEINHPAIGGIPMTVETPILRQLRQLQLLLLQIQYITGWCFGTSILFSQKSWVAIIIPIDFHSIILQKGSSPSTNQITYP